MTKSTPTTYVLLVRRFSIVLFVFALLFSGTLQTLAAASPSNIITYQARILNANGVPVSDASLSLKFEFYTASSGGTCLWSNSSGDCDSDTPASTTARTVTLTDGLISENLGDTSLASPYAAIADSLFSDNATVYLQVYIAGETLSPRKLVTAAPYALNASALDGLQSTDFDLDRVYDNDSDTILNVDTSDLEFSLDASGLDLIVDLQDSGDFILQDAGSAFFTVNDDQSIDYSFSGTTSDAIEIDSEATTGDTLEIDGLQTTTGSIVEILGGDFTDDSGLALNIDVTESTATADILKITTDFSSSDNVVFYIEADGEIFTDVGLTSTGSEDLVLNAGSGTVGVIAGDDFVVNPTADPFTTVGSFSIDSSANLMRLGNGSGSDASIAFYASDSDTGSITYIDTDEFEFAGGNIQHSGVPAYDGSPTVRTSMMRTTGTISTQASGGAGNYPATGFYGQLTNSAAEAGSHTHDITGVYGYGINTGTGQVEDLYGVIGRAENTSTDASAVGSALTGVLGQGVLDAAVTLTTVHGVQGAASVSDASGTITNAIGVSGTIPSSTGSITNGVAGDFENSAAGTNRYGVRSTASGGTTNYAGYFYGAPVHIESTSTPVTPLFATGAADLYVGDQLEVGGMNQTTGTMAIIGGDGLTSGQGLYVARSNNGSSDFTNTSTGLVTFEQGDTSASSTGNLLYLTQAGTGNALQIAQAGDGIALNVTATDTTDFVATFTAGGAGDDNDGISIQACANSNPTTGCDLVKFFDGGGTVIGAIEGNGSGGVQLTSGSGADFAELFPGTLANFARGDVLALDQSGEVALASDDVRIIGAYSVAPIVLGNAQQDWQTTGDHVPVALVGQVPVNVNVEGGTIAPGDYLTLSSTDGVATKATGVGYTLGRALESHTSGTGTIQAYISPGWHSADLLVNATVGTVLNDTFVIDGSAAADASTTGVHSAGFMLRGSGWDGTDAQDIAMVLQTDVTDASAYELSFTNNDGDEVAYINQDGDLAISGRLYPSDRGTMQSSKYIYYDGSTGAGGDFMRTNAAGWGAGSYDFAEMFPAIHELAAGEVVVFAADKESVQRSTGVTYDQRIAGIISTQPGFLAGENIEGHVPVALAGRVPTYVSGENGSIAVGDPLTTSSKAGYAMKATEAGPIVGYAMESFSGDTGAIITFVRPSYFDGAQETELPNNQISNVSSIGQLDVFGDLYLNSSSLISVGSISGTGGRWSIENNGDIRTKGRLIHVVDSHQGEQVDTYATTSVETTIELTGTVELKNGLASVQFEKINPQFNDVIAPDLPYRVFLTADGATGPLYAIERKQGGFLIRESGDASNAMVDWMVIAYHKDYVPTPVDLQEEETEEESEVVADDDSQLNEEVSKETVSGGEDTQVNPDTDFTTEEGEEESNEEMTGKEATSEETQEQGEIVVEGESGSEEAQPDLETESTTGETTETGGEQTVEEVVEESSESVNVSDESFTEEDNTDEPAL